MKYQLDLNFDQTYDSLEEAFIHALHCSGWSINSLAGELGYSPAGLSKRLNQYPQDNDPRLSVKDLEKFIQITGSALPIKYLVKKFLTKKEDREKELLEDLKKDLPKFKAFVQLLEGKTEGKK